MTAKTHYIEHVTPAMANKHRMHKIRIGFRELGILNATNTFISAFPEYNTATEGMAVRTVWNGNSGRSDIVDRFEELLNKLTQHD